MGQRDAARVDVMAVLDVARRYDAVADVIESALQTHLAQARFGAAVAGRAHTAKGEEVRAAIGLLADQLRTWVRASSEIASALRVSTDRYATVDADGASRLG